MKKALLFLLTLCMLLPLVACSETTDDGYTIYPGYQLLSNDMVDYNILAPDGWQVDNRTAMPFATCSSVDPTNLSVITQRLDDPISLGDYWERYGKGDAALLGAITIPHTDDGIDGLKNWPEDGKDMLLERKGTAEKVAAKRYIYSIKRGETTYVIDQTISILGENVYIITLTAKAENYSLHWAEMDDILKFFQFRV